MALYVLCVFLVVPFLLDNSAALSANDVQYRFLDNNYNQKEEKDLKIAKNKPLIAFLHGWKSSAKSDILTDIGKSLAQLTDSNVAMVDWSEWTLKLDYTVAASTLPAVSEYLVEWLNGLRDRGVVGSFDDVTLIGHSLGAQLVGYVGHRLNGTVKRIVALDPAQPNFRTNQKNERVDVNSAQFVMVLHTSTLFFGLKEPVGHVDFYFNGGQLQPSCFTDTVCSHIIVLDYLVDSLKNPNTFSAHRCSTLENCEKNTVDTDEPTIYMNIDIPSSTRGLYSVIPKKINYTTYSQMLQWASEVASSVLIKEIPFLKTLIDKKSS